MKKLLLLSLLISFLSTDIIAQLPDGSCAPQFEAKDINGDTHDLYALLNQGKSVILDVSATWCPPCWSYHVSGVLDNVWEEYGPEGSDEIYVFFIEGDGSTNMDDLLGNTGASMGNWVEGTPYPILDNASIANKYDISYFPTLYFICPNRYLTEAGQLPTAEAFHDLHSNCAPLVGNTNAAILDFEEYDGPTCGNIQYEPEMKIQNMGSDNMTSAEIEISVNGEVVEIMNWTGDLAAYEFTEVNLPQVPTTETFDLQVDILTVNGAADENSADNLVNTNIVLPKIADEKAQFIINTDNHGDEIYWVIYSPQGQIIAQGGNPNVGLGNTNTGERNPDFSQYSYGNNEEIIVDLDLPTEGCHFFFISDYFGDGICCEQGSGSYKLIDSQGTMIFEGGDYGAAKTFQFERLFYSDVEEEVLNTSLNIVPNPSNGQFSINMDLIDASTINMTIQNIQGKLVRNLGNQDYHSGSNLINVDLTDLNNGVYFLNVSTDKGVFSEKIVISK